MVGVIVISSISSTSAFTSLVCSVLTRFPTQCANLGFDYLNSLHGDGQKPYALDRSPPTYVRNNIPKLFLILHSSMVQTPTIGLMASGAGSLNGSARGSPAVGTSAGNMSTANGAKSKGTLNGNGYHPTNPQLPLSSMRSAPLDLRSVERRGQPTQGRETTKRNRPFGLQEAPTYRPSDDEWKDPFEYIRKISPEASKYGLCKIIPPDSWNPDFAIDTEVRYLPAAPLHNESR